MSAPNVRVACEALRQDAALWDNVAEAIRGAAEVARGLTLLDKLGQIPQLAGSGKALTGYDEFRQKAATSLAVGADVLGDIATTVRQIADTFEQEDVRGAHRMDQAGGGQ